VNYYEHHIGDYAEATSHLTLLEDAIYSRLLRKYYATERALIGDVKKLERLVGAKSKAERNAVAAVLEEFFTLEDDGCWHNARCDEEIAKYQAGEPERAAKKANEEERVRRHREERARLFEALRTAGIHMPWDTKIGELRELVQRHCNAPATAPATQPETLPATAPATPATATQTPDTTTHISNTAVPIGTDAGGVSLLPAGGDEPRSKLKPDEIIFGYGVPLLTSAGSTDKAARSFLGGLRKTHGDSALIDKLRACIRAKPLQPLEWLAKALPPPAVLAPHESLAARNAASTEEAMRLLGAKPGEVIDA